MHPPYTFILSHITPLIPLTLFIFHTTSFHSYLARYSHSSFSHHSIHFLHTTLIIFFTSVHSSLQTILNIIFTPLLSSSLHHFIHSLHITPFILFKSLYSCCSRRSILSISHHSTYPLPTTPYIFTSLHFNSFHQWFHPFLDIIYLLCTIPFILFTSLYSSSLNYSIRALPIIPFILFTALHSYFSYEIIYSLSTDSSFFAPFYSSGSHHFIHLLHTTSFIIVRLFYSYSSYYSIYPLDIVSLILFTYLHSFSLHHCIRPLCITPFVFFTPFFLTYSIHPVLVTPPIIFTLIHSSFSHHRLILVTPCTHPSHIFSFIRISSLYFSFLHHLIYPLPIFLIALFVSLHSYSSVHSIYLLSATPLTTFTSPYSFPLHHSFHPFSVTRLIFLAPFHLSFSHHFFHYLCIAIAPPHSKICILTEFGDSRILALLDL